MNITPHEEYIPLTPSAFYVLLALAEKPMYGYGVVEQIEFDSANEVTFDRANIYRTIARLSRLKLVEPAYQYPGAGSPHDRRYIQLTSAGSQVLAWECNRYKGAAALGMSRLARAQNHETISL